MLIVSEGHRLPKQQVEPAGRPSNSISVELTCSKTFCSVSTSSSLDSSSSLVNSVPATSGEEDEEDKDHLRCLTVVSQSWSDFDRLSPQCRTLFDQTIEEVRHDFCQTLVQSFSDRSPSVAGISLNLLAISSTYPRLIPSILLWYPPQHRLQSPWRIKRPSHSVCLYPWHRKTCSLA